MRLTAYIDRLDDLINPIVVKELRQAVRSRAVVAILLIFLGLQLFLVGINLVLGQARTSGSGVDMTAGRDIFPFIQGALLVTLMLLVPAYACIRLASERSDHNVDLLFISTLRPHSIIAGKFFAALMLAVLIFSACAPFMTFTYLLRGIDMPTIFTVLGIDLLCMVAGTMIALFLAALPGGRIVKVFACGAGFVGLLFLCIFLVTGTTALSRFGVTGISPREYWISVAAISATTLGVVGLLFCYAVALVSPTTSNRVLPLRVYVLTVWLLTGAGLFLVPQTPGGFEFPIALFIWTAVWSIVLGLQFLISLCERDHWGPRVARAIPQRMWLRVPAFFLYTGAAGGLALSLILITITLGGGGLWLYFNEGADPRAHELVGGTVGLCLMSLGYLLCYGLSAVLVRVYLLSGQVRHGFTWVIVLLLVGLGSAIPGPLVMILYPEQMRPGTEGTWWKLPSPFIAFSEVAPPSDAQFVQHCTWFLGVWGWLAALAVLPWFIGQIWRFHPPVREQALEEVEVEVVADDLPASEPAAASPDVNGAAAAEDQATSEHITSIQTG